MTDQRVRPGKFVAVTCSLKDDAGNLLEQSDLPVSDIQGRSTDMIGAMDRAGPTSPMLH